MWYVFNVLLLMIEKWWKSLDEVGAFETLPTDLPKAFDYLPHKLLIAKLHAYRVDTLSLKLLQSYLSKQKQRVKLSDTYSSWSNIIFGVLQHSILGLLLFNIFLCDLFQFFSDLDIFRYAYNETLHPTNIN